MQYLLLLVLLLGSLFLHRYLKATREQEIFRAEAENRLMELFLFHFRQTGYTLKQVFLLTPAYGTVDPATLEAMFSTNFSSMFSFGPKSDITFPMFGNGIFTQEGDAWKRSREMLRPQLVHRQYEDLQVFQQPIEDLLRVLPKHGGVVDLQPLFFRFTLDVTTAFLFEKSINSLLTPENSQEQTFAQAFDTAQSYVASRFRLLDLYWLIGGRKWRNACAKGQNDGRYVSLKSVAKASPDRAALRGQIINILAAGRDTTACLLSWTLHSRVMEKLRSEISTLPVKEEEVKRTDLRNLHYLQNILKETLRLYPSLPVNTRTSIKTTILPTGGGPDRMSPTLHRRPDLYGIDAEYFRPERWDEDLPLFRDRTTQNYGYLPFHGGPRICLEKGEKVELLGVEMQITTLVLKIAEGCKVALG
ncbi:cytochrome P450 alkane hydroxylase [Xylaria sp. FL1042]|nr:cytochrome P450 alkane hydroxylase [Xylaria sp. FL1042]